MTPLDGSEGSGTASPRNSVVAAAFAEHWPVIVARLARRYGDLALAEDCTADAFAAAVHAWRVERPANPGGWLWTAAQRRAIDRLRRRGTEAAHAAEVGAHQTASQEADVDQAGLEPPGTEELALLFGCCHPSLSPPAQVALTLRAVNGLSTRQIAQVFLVSVDTMTRRLTRARTKLAANAVPFEIPDPEHWSQRLDPVLAAIYLTFTAGHAATDHQAPLLRGDVCDEARWLVAQVARVAPADPEVLGLSALMDLTDARRPARLDADGNAVLMAEQDRSRWDRALLASGRDTLRRALSQRRLGPYQVQAALSACHVLAPTWEDTDFSEIVRWYDVLLTFDPGPINRLNRAVAVCTGGDARRALADFDALAPELAGYHYLWVARADAHERLGDEASAVADLNRALALDPHPAEAAQLRRRMTTLSCAVTPSPGE